MYFASFQDALFMAGHGIYVWPCYLVTFLVLLSLVFHPLFLAKKNRKQIHVKIKRLELQKSKESS